MKTGRHRAPRLVLTPDHRRFGGVRGDELQLLAHLPPDELVEVDHGVAMADLP